MSYASDKLYSGYLRTNMPRIVTSVKPREIVVHLPCLTDHDRETIEAKRETCGSFDAMVRLLDCLKRRENWPEQFIAALEACEHRIIAAEIRAEYDALRGINDSAPPAANVVTAHVHPAPSAPHLPDPGAAASAQTAQDVQSKTPVTQPIQETENPAPQSAPAPAAAPLIELTTPPEQPPAETKTVLAPPVTPPPSPDSVRGSANPSPPPEQVNIISHPEPEEDLEPEPLPSQDAPNEVINVRQEAEENMELPQAPELQAEPCEIDNPMQTSSIVDQPSPILTIVKENTSIIYTVIEPTVAESEPATAVMEDTSKPTNTVEEVSLTSTILDNPTPPPAAVEASPGLSVSPVTNLDDLILTPEKPPVQETSPLGEMSVVPVLEKTFEPQNTQVVEIAQETEVHPRPPAELENGASAANHGSVSEDDIFFSKPGILVSVEPSDQNNTTIRPPTPEYSGDSGRLEMSEAVPPCQENGINRNKQDEEVSEDDIQEYVGHVAEEPSILNKEVQSQLMEASDGITKEINIAPPIAFSTLISDPSLSTEAGDICESEASNLDVEDAEENVLEQPSMVNPTPLTEDAEDPAVELEIPATNMISATTSESPDPSLDMDDVRENIGHVMEDPSVLNLVQPPMHQIEDEDSDREFKAAPFGIASITNVEQEAQMPLIQVNGEPAQEIAPVPPNSTPSVNDIHTPIDPKQPDSGKTTSILNSRYILTAAGVGACALLIAWRFKH